jgi:hypothetical protein
MPYLTLYLVSFITLASHILMSWLAYFWGNSFIKIKVIQKKQGHLILAALLIILPYLNLIKNTFTLDAEILFVSLLFLISIFYLWKTEFFKIDKAYDN